MVTWPTWVKLDWHLDKVQYNEFNESWLVVYSGFLKILGQGSFSYKIVIK